MSKKNKKSITFLCVYDYDMCWKFPGIGQVKPKKKKSILE